MRIRPMAMPYQALCASDGQAANLMMGVQLIEQARQHGVEKFVALGTICAYPKFAPIPC